MTKKVLSNKHYLKKLDNNWVIFGMNNFFGEAQVFPEGSDFGIGGGRVSRLFVFSKKTGDMVFSYERGLSLDQLPKGSLFKILNLLCDQNTDGGEK